MAAAEVPRQSSDGLPFVQFHLSNPLAANVYVCLQPVTDRASGTPQVATTLPYLGVYLAPGEKRTWAVPLPWSRTALAEGPRSAPENFEPSAAWAQRFINTVGNARNLAVYGSAHESHADPPFLAPSVRGTEVLAPTASATHPPLETELTYLLTAAVSTDPGVRRQWALQATVTSALPNLYNFHDPLAAANAHAKLVAPFDAPPASMWAHPRVAAAHVPLFLRRAQSPHRPTPDYGEPDYTPSPSHWVWRHDFLAEPAARTATARYGALGVTLTPPPASARQIRGADATDAAVPLDHSPEMALRLVGPDVLQKSFPKLWRQRRGTLPLDAAGTVAKAPRRSQANSFIDAPLAAGEKAHRPMALSSLVPLTLGAAATGARASPTAATTAAARAPSQAHTPPGLTVATASLWVVAGALVAGLVYRTVQYARYSNKSHFTSLGRLHAVNSLRRVEAKYDKVLDESV